MTQLLKFLGVHVLMSFAGALAENAGGHLYHTVGTAIEKKFKPKKKRAHRSRRS